MLRVYIGRDNQFGVKAAQVCKDSLLANASIPVSVTMLDQDWLRKAGLYRRHSYVADGQHYDTIDGRPFSTEFSFTRFLTPFLQPDGWAIFCDGDFLWRKDIADLPLDDQYSLMCVKHNYKPTDKTKMLGQIQEGYPRKNWSSLMAFNVPKNTLTPQQVNTEKGSWLHGMQWLDDRQIGSIDATWNALDGDSANPDPSAYHYTLGTPDMPGHEFAPFAQEWSRYGN
tara:strand:+ start:12375 stop:13052 length:678 start_codon:yes stop_codon:yes gene_type:complete